MQEIGKTINEDIKFIACNYEKYMAFYLGRHLVFLDRFQFMSSSHDKLSNNLPKDEFVYTDMVFQDKAGLTWILLRCLRERDCPLNEIFIAF